VVLLNHPVFFPDGRLRCGFLLFSGAKKIQDFEDFSGGGLVMTETIVVVAIVVVVFALFSFMAAKAERIVEKQAEEQRLAVEATAKKEKKNK